MMAVVAGGDEGGGCSEKVVTVMTVMAMLVPVTDTHADARTRHE